MCISAHKSKHSNQRNFAGKMGVDFFYLCILNANVSGCILKFTTCEQVLIYFFVDFFWWFIGHSNFKNANHDFIHQ